MATTFAWLPSRRASRHGARKQIDAPLYNRLHWNLLAITSAEPNDSPIVMLTPPIATLKIPSILRRPMVQHSGNLLPTFVDSPSLTRAWNGNEASSHSCHVCAAMSRHYLVTTLVYGSDVNAGLSTITREWPRADCNFSDFHFLTG